jgi:membrane protein
VGARFAAAVKRAIAPVREYSLAVWARDRAPLGGWAALWTRIARIVTLSVRGVRKHKLSLQASALAYYTLFSIVPVLVVALWVLKLFHLLHYLIPEEVAPPPDATAAGTASEMHVPEANVMLRSALRAILSAVDRAGRLEAGIVGLIALGYGVIRQLVHVEAALNTIAGRRDRPARRWRLLGYLALLALPPALLIVSGLLRSLSRVRAGAAVEGAASWLFAALPLLKSALSGAVGVGILCLALTIFYGSAMRARVARASTVFGAAIGALSLAGVLWAFARLQIGVSRAGALQSGMAAVPVFLLWAFSSWLVVLIGAEAAVAHELDGILVHGVRAWRLDPYDEQMAGVQIMVAATEGALAKAPAEAGLPDGATTANELARQLRLLPESVREVAGRLLAAGLLRRVDGDAYLLACDPDRAGLRDVVGAVIGGPESDRRARRGRRAGPTLRELVARERVTIVE